MKMEHFLAVKCQLVSLLYGGAPVWLACFAIQIKDDLVCNFERILVVL